MKKLSLILLLAALALPMMAQNFNTKAEAMVKPDKTTLEQGVTTPLNQITMTPVQIQRDGTIIWDFDTDETFGNWESLDYDGDGYGWEVDDYYSHSGEGYSLCSRSYYGGALDPDNWLISEQVTLGGTLSLWSMNYMSSWPDKIAVYVCVGEPTSVNDFVKVGDDIIPPTTWTEYTVDLSEFQGQGCFAIRHYDSYDNYRIFVDDITLTFAETAKPENLYVEPSFETADVTWDDEENVAWNLRYREYVTQPEPTGYFWDFEDCYGALPEGFTTNDADGDGFTWDLWDPEAYGYDPGDGVRLNGKKCATSASYNSYGALTPDNWLITPEVTLQGNLSFWAAGQDPSYAGEVFAVYLSTDGETWEKISEDITATSPIQEYTFDLTPYAGRGTGRIAIRHYNVSDMFRLNIDDILIGEKPEPVEEPEWIYVENLDATNYTIEGLIPETTYEVQVQGINEEGGTSGWTDSFVFTTTEDTAVEELVIETKGDNNYYNLMGQKVDAANLTTGIYIHNGKKILVK